MLLTGYTSEVSTIPSSGSINLLEQLTELRKTFYLLDYPFIVKEYNSSTARQKRCIGQGVGERAKEALWACHSPSTSSCLSTGKLSESGPFGFLWRFHYIGMVD